jgi:hypothetical protein
MATHEQRASASSFGAALRLFAPHKTQVANVWLVSVLGAGLILFSIGVERALDQSSRHYFNGLGVLFAIERGAYLVLTG